MESRPALFRAPAPRPLRRPPDLFTFFRAARKNPLESWTEEHFEKPILAAQGVLGRVTVLSDPAAIRHVLLDNARNYRKDDLQRRVLAPGLANGLLTAEGEEWRAQRRALAPLFSPRHVAGFAAAMDEAAQRLIRRLLRRGDGRTLDVAVEMTRVTLDVLERTIFTHGLTRDPDALGRAITRYFDAIGPVDPLDVLGLPDWLPRIGRIRARPALRFFDEIVTELIEARKALLTSGESAPEDLLTLLLGATDPETGHGLKDMEVRANIVTFIGAGHETTANALSWSLYLLSQAPEIRARVEDEADTVFDEEPGGPPALERLPLTRAVVDEAMRLYPPVPFMSRAAIREDRIGAMKIPAGSLVMIAPYVLHRHRRLWENPDSFDPDRFMPGRRETIDRYAYLPFGAGPRVCIGSSFSVQEAVIVLARFVHALGFELAEGHRVTPVQRVTLRPGGGLPMRLRARAN
ncbi:cytochrome P450 [Enterovirga sp. CN4-39]|uniref:cytochrome P450 n=1 Tax=Enterovirga sp. CN4-39 TaxID=3400910 RepID=UPI003C0180FF